MEERRLFLRVGGFLALGIILLATGVFVLTGNRWEPGRLYETYFRESVQGLDVGAPVKFRGVSIGRVTNIGLVSAEYAATAAEQIMNPAYRLIVVRFKVDPRRIGVVPDTEDAVAHGLRVKLANQGLTGVMYLEVDFMSPDDNPVPKVPWEPQDDYIPSVPSTIAELGSAVQKLLQEAQKVDFKGISVRATQLLDNLNAELAARGDVHQALLEITATLHALQDVVQKADLPALSAQLRQTGRAFEQLANGPRTQDILARTDAAVAKLPALISQLQALSRRADDGVADIEAEAAPLLQDARAAVQNLREATDTLRRDPGAVLFGGPPPHRRP